MDAGFRRHDSSGRRQRPLDDLAHVVGQLALRRDASDRLGQVDGDGTPSESADLTYRQLRRDLITVEEAELQRLYEALTE